LNATSDVSIRKLLLQKNHIKKPHRNDDDLNDSIDSIQFFGNGCWKRILANANVKCDL
jgi:hypothetical protein